MEPDRRHHEAEHSLGHVLAEIHRKVDQIMADTSGLKAAVERAVDGMDSANSKLDDLAAKLAEGGSVSQADLDSLRDELNTASDSLSEHVTVDDPDVQPPANPPTAATDSANNPSEDATLVHEGDNAAGASDEHADGTTVAGQAGAPSDSGTAVTDAPE